MRSGSVAIEIKRTESQRKIDARVFEPLDLKVKVLPVVFHFKVTISGVVHAVGYEITFFAVKPAPIATSPITKIHLDLSPESSLFIKLTY